mgnify:FL=1|tara:strand:+ start:2068 stop:3003 length:936 start_codon:yes stop_codon:yes gene_type:complete
MAAWMNNYATDCLLFDCEWSKRKRVGVGVIQFATLPSTHQVLVVDCTRVDLANVQSIFDNHLMVGWATDNDVRHLGLDGSNNIVDLQGLSSQPPSNMREEDRARIEKYQPVDHSGKPHNQSWSLDDMAQCFLDHPAKVPIVKHPKWSNPEWQLRDRDIHYAANDVIAVAYIYDKLKYMYKPSALLLDNVLRSQAQVRIKQAIAGLGNVETQDRMRYVGHVWNDRAQLAQSSLTFFATEAFPKLTKELRTRALSFEYNRLRSTAQIKFMEKVSTPILVQAALTHWKESHLVVTSATVFQNRGGFKLYRTNSK